MLSDNTHVRIQIYQVFYHGIVHMPMNDVIIVYNTFRLYEISRDTYELNWSNEKGYLFTVSYYLQ